jgi:hypothetical protein
VVLGLSQTLLNAGSNLLEAKRFSLVVTSSSDSQNYCEFFQPSL